MKKLSTILVVLVMMIVLVACRSGEVDDGSQVLRIGFAQSSNANPWMVALTESMADESERLGVEYVYTDANGQIDRHVSNIRDMLLEDLDYLVVSPLASTGLEEVLEEAQKLNIPVVLTGRTTKGPYVTTVHSDQAWEGEQCGLIIGEDNPRARVIELRGLEGTSSVEGRAKGFRKALEQVYPEVEIIAQRSANFNMTEAMELTASLIKEFGDEGIDVIFAHNDSMALGAIQGIIDEGLVPGRDIKVIGIDGQKEAIDAIIRGEMMASVQCSPKIGSHVFNVIMRLESGESVDQETIVPDLIFDIDNAKEAYESTF